MNEKVKLSSPWMSFYHEMEALFKEDPEIMLAFDEDKMEIRMFVDNEDKADALQQLMPAERVFGNTAVKIMIIPANLQVATDTVLFQRAFSGNPAFSYITSVESVFSNPISYVVFKNKVVQYFNDNLGDVNGNYSTLYQDIAKDIFGDHPGIFFCTDKE